MGCEIKWVLNKMPKTEDKDFLIISVVKVKKARTFHEGTPQYQVTPLADLRNTAGYLGLAEACVKDESCWFGLDAFKVLGGSHAIARYIAKETKCGISQMPYSILISRELCDELGQTTFSSTTDGDHGRGTTWAASHLGQKCVTRMPVGSIKNRHHHIEDEDVECTIEKVNYDDCIRMVAGEAKHTEHGAVIQDTARGGYEEIPFWIIQGYSTMADEAVGQFEERPTHVLVQVGAESLAGGVMGYFASKYKRNPPVMVVVETEPVAYFYKGAEAADEETRIADGEVSTIMAGLCCGEPNIASLDILENHVTAFLAVNDDMARRDMCMLAAPSKGDPQITSGKSDTAAFGALATIMKDEACRGLCSELGLDQDSKVLMFSTEGDTDPDHYRIII